MASPLSLDVDIFFGWFQRLPVDVVQQLVVIPVLLQEGVSACPSTPPS